MKNRGNQLLLLLIVILSLIVTFGCAPAQVIPADYMSSSFNATEIDHIYVMPVLDYRFNKGKELNLDKLVHRAVEFELKRRKYKYTCIKERSLIADIEQEDMEELEGDWISAIAPQDSQWLLFIALLDSSSKLTFGSTGSAEMTAYLIDKSTKEIIWRNKDIGRMGQGGLVGMMMKGAMESEAIHQASRKLMFGLPVYGLPVQKFSKKLASSNNSKTALAVTPIAVPIKPKAAAKIEDDIFNPNEPWTGTWKVTGHRDSFVLKLKQSGNTAKSIRGSGVNFKGKVKGDRLKGRYSIQGWERNGNFKINNDFNSFQGAAHSDWNTSKIKGERQ